MLHWQNKASRTAAGYQEDEKKAIFVDLACESGWQHVEIGEEPKIKRSKVEENGRALPIKDVEDIDSILSSYLNSKSTISKGKEAQFLKKMDSADCKLELDRQIHVDKVDAEKEDRRLREIDMVQRNKTLSDMMIMMQEMCDRGNSSSK